MKNELLLCKSMNILKDPRLHFIRTKCQVPRPITIACHPNKNLFNSENLYWSRKAKRYLSGWLCGGGEGELVGGGVQSELAKLVEREN